MEIKMWEQIKKFFGFFDTNRDGKFTVEDIDAVFAQAVVEAKAEKLNDVVIKNVKKVKEPVEDVKEEVAEVKVAAGKGRPGRKKKTQAESIETDNEIEIMAIVDKYKKSNEDLGPF
jgi:hypothetical protein